MIKIVELEGVGEAYALKLNGAGIVNIEDLLKAGGTAKGRADLEGKTGIRHDLILEWVNHADLVRVDGVGVEYADLLEEAGVDTCAELANRKPENLHEKLTAINEQKKLVRRLPSVSQVTAWVECAKGLPKLVTY